MQAFSAFSSQGAALATTRVNSDAFPSHRWRRRKKAWSFSFHPAKYFCGWVSARPSWRSGLDDPMKRRSSFGCSFVLALALSQEPSGSENVNELVESDMFENKKTNSGSLGRVRNDGVVDSMVDGDRDQVEKEKVDVRELALSILDAKTADDVEAVFKDFEDLPLPAYSSMIRGFGNNRRMDPVFALVEWLKRKEKDTGGVIGPNLFIYNSLLGAIKQAKMFEKVDEVMDDMRLHGVVPNIVTYNALMSVYIEQGRLDEALDVLIEIEKKGLIPTPVTYSTALLAYRKMEDANSAIAFFVKVREMYEKGEVGKDEEFDWENEFVKLENFTVGLCYLVMRHWLVKEDHPGAKVFKLLKGMDDAKLRQTRQDYERLVWACTRESHYTVAKELYRRIRESEREISLSVCNHIIWLMGKAKKWWAALEIYEELLDKGPKPNNVSYELIISHFNVLLNAARKRGIWRWGVRLLNKMQDKGLRPGTREWNAVLVACSKASETTASVQIFKRMVEQGEKPTILSYGALLSALEKGKLYDEALQVWEHMCKVGVKPNLHAYTILASIYVGKGKHDEVDGVLQEMTSSGIQPTVVTYNAIITGCAKNQMGAAAFEWFHRMKVRNIKPNEITYEMLVVALAQDAKPRLAYEMYLRACNEGLNLSTRSYDAVLKSCHVNGTSIDLNALGPRPPEKKKVIKIRKNLTEFCNLAGLPRRVKPFDRTELYASQMQGTQ